uniref:Integrin-binding sialoprotein n=1 Tax=Jaculus jaculus TaxID=51337 RepID=A0A8C5JYJ1_JACJA
MKTALIFLSILGLACAFSMKNLHRRIKVEDSEENGIFKFRPRYYLYKHAYFYPPLKRFPVQGNSDSSEENEDGDSSDEEEEEETSNEEENNEESNGNEGEDSEADNSTLPATTPGYGEATAPGTASAGFAALQLPKVVTPTALFCPRKLSLHAVKEEEEEGNEAEVEDNEQAVNGTSANSTEVDNGRSGGDTGEGAAWPATPLPEADASTPPPAGSTPAEYEQTGNHEYDPGYEVYDSEHGEPRGDNYRAYEDEYSYYKGRGYAGYEGQDYYYHQ